jgi:hypothetical protein
MEGFSTKKSKQHHSKGMKNHYTFPTLFLIIHLVDEVSYNVFTKKITNFIVKIQ